MAVVSQLAKGIQRFFRWWFGQLAAMVPVPLRLFFRSRPDTVVVDISGSEVVVLRCGDRTCDEIGRFPAMAQSEAGGDDEAPVKLALASAGAARQRTALRLSATQALRRSINLPAAAETDLHDILSHQIEQLTPFQAHEACFGYRITDRDRASGQIEVELTVVPKKYVDAALSEAGTWGFAPDMVDISDQDPRAAPEINLIAGNGAAGRPNPWPRVNAALAVVAVVLAFVAVLIPLDNARNTADGLFAQATELRRSTKEILDLRRERDGLRKRVRFIADQKLGQPSTLDILNELTRIISKDTWLYEVRINRPEIRISGYSPSASSLIGKINDSPMFRNPRFRSPVTRPGNMDKERFNLSFESGPGPQAGGK